MRSKQGDVKSQLPFNHDDIDTAPPDPLDQGCQGPMVQSRKEEGPMGEVHMRKGRIENKSNVRGSHKKRFKDDQYGEGRTVDAEWFASLNIDSL